MDIYSHRLLPSAFSVRIAQMIVRRNGGESFPYPLTNAKRDFRHTLRQWKALGIGSGHGNKAMRRAEQIERKTNGAYLVWPDYLFLVVHAKLASRGGF